MTESLTPRQRRVLRDLSRRLDDLPVLPAVISQIATLNPTSISFADRVENLVRSDPTLVIRLLRHACSGNAEGADPVITIPRAIALMGARRLAETITSVAIARVFVPTTPGQRNLWRHAQQVAVASRTIADLNAERGLSREYAYLAGLLHDIGRFVLFDRSADELGAVDECGWRTPAELIEAEVRISGFDHAFLGAAACEVWSLPEELVSVVRSHHVYAPELTEDWTRDFERAVQTVQVADNLSVQMLVEPGFEKLPEAELTKRIHEHCIARQWEKPPVAPRALAAHVRAIADESDRLSRSLQMILPPAEL